MTPSLAAAVRDVVPGLFTDSSPSIVRIETTRPVFLLFGSDWSRPECVARIGTREDLGALDRALGALHRRVPDLVPASLALVPWQGDQYLHVQEGLPGLPWFALQEALRSEAEWTRLEDRAGRALVRLHAAIIEQPEWRCRMRPGEQLRQQVQLLIAQDPKVSSVVRDALAAAGKTLDTLGEIAWFWQHGDFCVNNLLVGRTSVGIVDFDEFGVTSVPLQDEIGLGVSVHELSSSTDDWGSLGRHVLACARETLERHPRLAPHLPALFQHYLVWRINRAFGRPTRTTACARLQATLKASAEAPGRFFPR